MKLRRVEYSIGRSLKNANQTKMGWFHGWFQWQDGDEAGCLATIEQEDGTVGEHSPEWIRFLDKPTEDQIVEGGLYIKINEATK